jgi:hypothetical protein
MIVYITSRSGITKQSVPDPSNNDITRYVNYANNPCDDLIVDCAMH